MQHQTHRPLHQRPDRSPHLNHSSRQSWLGILASLALLANCPITSQAEESPLKLSIEHRTADPENPSRLQLIWDSAPSYYYYLEQSPALTEAYSPLDFLSHSISNSQIHYSLDPSTLDDAPRQFFRLHRYESTDPFLQEDSDADGLSNHQESQFRSNAFRRDSDFDGYEDYNEYIQGTDPNDSGDHPSAQGLKLYASVSDLNLDDDRWSLTASNSRLGSFTIASNVGNVGGIATGSTLIHEGETLSFQLVSEGSDEKFTDEYLVSFSDQTGTEPPLIILNEAGTPSVEAGVLHYSAWLEWTNENTTPPDVSDENWSFYLPNRSLLARDLNSNTGDRSSYRALVLVTSGGVARTAEIQCLDSSTHLPGGYPQWPSSYIASSYNGSRSATFRGNATTSIQAYLSSGLPTRPITLTLVDENAYHTSYDFNSTQLQSVQNAINSVLNAIGGGELNLSGSLSAEFKRVDLYDDGTRYGHAAQISGSLSASFPDISITSPPVPIPGTPAYMTFSGGFEGTEITLSANTDYDQSHANPGQVSGTLKGKTTGVISSEAAFNMVVLEVIARAYGSATFNASGTLSLANASIVLDGSVGIGDLTAGISARVKVGEEIYEAADFSHVFEYATSEPFSKTLYTFQ